MVGMGGRGGVEGGEGLLQVYQHTASVSNSALERDLFSEPRLFTEKCNRNHYMGVLENTVIGWAINWLGIIAKLNKIGSSSENKKCVNVTQMPPPSAIV